MTRVLGLDGARGGWVGALVDTAVTGGDPVTWHLFGDVADALACDVAAIGVDMPIGLPEEGRRTCDLLAKRLLGRAHPRVFLAPPRAVLAAATYDEANLLHRGLTGGLGLSVQTWHVVAKIVEVDAVADDARVVEVHPELSFAALAGDEPLPSKKTAAGRARREQLLRGWLPGLGPVPAGDDAPDALVVAWSALRWLRGRTRTLPDDPPVDARGRPMRIVT